MSEEVQTFRANSGRVTGVIGLVMTVSVGVLFVVSETPTVAVRRYLLIRSGGVKYICPAISRSLRKTVRSEMRWNGGNQMLAPGLQGGDLQARVQTDVQGSKGVDYADFVESQIIHLANVDRAARGIEAR